MRRGRMDANLILLVALTLIAAGVAFQRDARLPMQGLAATGRLMNGVWIELLLGFRKFSQGVKDCGEVTE